MEHDWKMWAVLVAVGMQVTAGVYWFGSLANRVTSLETANTSIVQFMKDATEMRTNWSTRLGIVEAADKAETARNMQFQHDIRTLYGEQKSVRGRINELEEHVHREIGREEVERKR